MTDFTCFKNKVALITGGGGTLGGDTALQFVQYGAKVALVDIEEERLEKTVDALKREGAEQGQIFFQVGDVTKEEDVKRFVDEAVNQFGSIDYVVNIVGLKRMGDILTLTLDDLDTCLTSTVRSAFLVSKAALPHLTKTQGCIVNMSSVSGIRAHYNALPYGTSKAALNHMTRIMASGLAKHRVRVNAVCPATCYSEFNLISGHTKSKEELEKYLAVSSRAIPFGRLCKVQEATKTILFLCSTSAGFTTGAVLPIDGAYGQTLYEPPN